jgi:hypothetical protein
MKPATTDIYDTALHENRDQPRFIKRHRGVLKVNHGFPKKNFPWEKQQRGVSGSINWTSNIILFSKHSLCT